MSYSTQAKEEGAPRVADRVAPGAEIGSYIIESLLAEGGMGEIYTASHRVLKRRAAVKILRAQMVGMPAARDGLVKEAQILDALNHPDVVQLYDAGILPDGRPWIAMELLAGECLGDRLHARGRLPYLESAQIVDGLAEVLMSAHAQGFVHRDIKPDNIMLDDSSGGLVTRVIDWGIAGEIGAWSHSEIAAGTPDYMAPEQVRGEPCDARTDVYALGAVAFEMITGRTPFVGDNAIEVAMQQISRAVPDVALWVDGVPEALSALLKRMMAKEPADRPDLAAVRRTLAALHAIEDRPRVEVAPDPTDEYYESLVSTPGVVRTRWTPAAPATPFSARQTQALPRIVSSAERGMAAGTIDVGKPQGN